ncbi:MAG TPA: hypothetical protein VFF39_06870 [Verrucomicrobiae bacterium]|nr:hypothetical protein [Verrucomicrobiae bacterium]
MGIGSMVRLTGRVAVFVAVAALLLQASCTIAPAPIANADVASNIDAGCHDSTPATPRAPDPGHICCSGEHSPEALLSSAVTPAPLTAVGLVRNLFFAASVRPNLASNAAPSTPGPPRLLTLRI